MFDSYQIGQRIKQRREALKMTQEELGASLRLNKSSIQRYESGQVKNIKLPIIQAISEKLDVDPMWLVGKTDVIGHSNSTFSQFDFSPLHRKRIPLLGEIACGEPIYANEDRESYVMAGTDINADFCLIAKGDSMKGARILNGDIVFIRKQDMVDNGEIAAVVIDDEATLKRVNYYPDKNLLILKAENPKYPDQIYTNEQLDTVKILGKAIAFESDVR